MEIGILNLIICMPTQRQKIYRLSQVTYVHGVTYYNNKSIAVCFTQFYRDLFISREPSQIDECLPILNTKVANYMNALPCKPFFCYRDEECYFLDVTL